MDYTNHHCCLTWPFEPSPGAQNDASRAKDCREPRSPCVGLADCIGGYEPEYAAGTKEAERPAKEIRDKIRIAMRALMQRLQPLQIQFFA